MEHYAECLESGTPLVLNNFGYLHFDEERQLDIRATSAAAEMITVTWRDVTDRFRAAQTDQRYRKLMDFSAVPAAWPLPTAGWWWSTRRWPRCWATTSTPC